jgi:hypothetical protein
VRDDGFDAIAVVDLLEAAAGLTSSSLLAGISN